MTALTAEKKCSWRLWEARNFVISNEYTDLAFNGSVVTDQRKPLRCMLRGILHEHQQTESRDRMLCTPAVCSGGPKLKSRSGYRLFQFSFMGYSLLIQANAGKLIYVTSPPLSHILSDSLFTNNSLTFVSYVTISCISVSITTQWWTRLPINRDPVPGWSKFSPLPRPDGTGAHPTAYAIGTGSGVYPIVNRRGV